MTPQKPISSDPRHPQHKYREGAESADKCWRVRLSPLCRWAKRNCGHFPAQCFEKDRVWLHDSRPPRPLKRLRILLILWRENQPTLPVLKVLGGFVTAKCVLEINYPRAHLLSPQISPSPIWHEPSYMNSKPEAPEEQNACVFPGTLAPAFPQVPGTLFISFPQAFWFFTRPLSRLAVGYGVGGSHCHGHLQHLQ